MKKRLLIFALSAYMSQLAAQTEIKLSPVPLLFGYVAASVEHGVSESIGIEGDFILVEDFVGGNVSGKYYFEPVKGIDRFHVGAFIGIQETVGIGFLLGYKWVSQKNVIFELGIGVGRSFDDGVIGYGKLHLGYRFEKKSKRR